jgi:hypothetical protein
VAAETFRARRMVGALTAALRNASSPRAPAPADVDVRGMRLQLGERTLLFKGISTVFTRQEWKLLTILVEHPNCYLTTREVLRLAGMPVPTVRRPSGSTCAACGSRWPRSTFVRVARAPRPGLLPEVRRVSEAWEGCCPCGQGLVPLP